MKIISEGKHSSRAWWVDKTVKCTYCEYEVQLEAGDETNVDFTGPVKSRGSGKYAVWVRCPCGEELELNRPETK